MQILYAQLHTKVSTVSKFRESLPSGVGCCIGGRTDRRKDVQTYGRTDVRIYGWTGANIMPVAILRISGAYKKSAQII